MRVGLLQSVFIDARYLYVAGGMVAVGEKSRARLSYRDLMTLARERGMSHAFLCSPGTATSLKVSAPPRTWARTSRAADGAGLQRYR